MLFSLALSKKLLWPYTALVYGNICSFHHVHSDTKTFFFIFVHDPNNYFPVACESGRKMEAMEELDTENKGFMATHLNQIKRWFLSHAQHLNFFTILVLASVSMDFVLHYQLDLFPLPLVISKKKKKKKISGFWVGLFSIPAYNRYWFSMIFFIRTKALNFPWFTGSY